MRPLKVLNERKNELTNVLSERQLHANSLFQECEDLSQELQIKKENILLDCECERGINVN